MKRKYWLLYLATGLLVIAGLLSVVPGFKFSIILCFGFAAFCAAMHFLQKHPKAKTINKFVCIFLVIGCLAAGVTGGFILSAAHPGELPSCDYIVVLGAGVRGSVPSLTLSERIGAAYDYLIANPDAKAILCGGQGPGEDITEADCMYGELTRMGIDSSRLFRRIDPLPHWKISPLLWMWQNSAPASAPMKSVLYPANIIFSVQQPLRRI